MPQNSKILRFLRFRPQFSKLVLHAVARSTGCVVVSRQMASALVCLQCSNVQVHQIRRKIIRNASYRRFGRSLLGDSFLPFQCSSSSQGALLKNHLEKVTQLSNLWWMPNSINKGFHTLMKTGSSRRFKRSPKTYRWVSSWPPFTVDLLILVYLNPQ